MLYHRIASLSKDPVSKQSEHVKSAICISLFPEVHHVVAHDSWEQMEEAGWVRRISEKTKRVTCLRETWFYGEQGGPGEALLRVEATWRTCGAVLNTGRLQQVEAAVQAVVVVGRRS